MGANAINTQISAILETVDGMGIVHRYERWAAHWSEFLAQFRDANGLINGWMVSRQATPAEWAGNPFVERTHSFRLRGLYGHNDAEATEITFQDLVDAVQDAFDGNPTLNGAVKDHQPLQVKTVELRVYGTVLCHYAECWLACTARKRISDS